MSHYSEINEEINEDQIIPNEKCILCQKNMQIRENENINHCNKCEGNLCDKCNKLHSKKNPNHKIITLKVFKLKKYVSNRKCSVFNNNLPNIDNNDIRNLIYNHLKMTLH